MILVLQGMKLSRGVQKLPHVVVVEGFAKKSYAIVVLQFTKELPDPPSSVATPFENFRDPSSSFCYFKIQQSFDLIKCT